MSDHSLISCKLSIHRENMRRETFDYRKIKSIDMVACKNGFSNSRRCDRDVMSSSSATDCADIFSEETRKLLDQIDPLKTIVKRQPTNDCRWKTDESRDAMRLCRKLDRRNLRTHMNCDRRAYNAARRHANSVTKRTHESIDEASGPREQLKVVNDLLHTKPYTRQR